MSEYTVIEKHDFNIISNSNLFDFNWFKFKYGIEDYENVVCFYVKYAIELNLKPTPYFDTVWYLERYPDVKDSGMNPFAHFIKYGIEERRFPNVLVENYDNLDDYFIILNSELLSWSWYVENYLGVNSIDPIIHYLDYGANLKLKPCPNFNILEYEDEFPIIKEKGLNPLVHYIRNINNDEISFENIENLNLKKCIKGHDGYLFLINDGNSELRQHFDKNYINKFDSEKFLEDYFFKKGFFYRKNMPYFYFIVPDKSVVCKDLIPFDNSFLKRNISQLNGIVPDFSENLDVDCYFKYDSHMNVKGGEILSFDILKYIDNSFDLLSFQELINNCDVVEFKEHNDLMSDANYSYSIEEKNSIHLKTLKNIRPHLENLDIPKQFEECNGRKSFFLKNNNSYSNLKVLIFRDSSFDYLMNYFSLYFNEMFVYWDHLELNKDLINWYNPDLVIEIRIERFIENYSAPLWVTNKEGY